MDCPHLIFPKFRFDFVKSTVQQTVFFDASQSHWPVGKDIHRPDNVIHSIANNWGKVLLRLVDIVTLSVGNYLLQVDRVAQLRGCHQIIDMESVFDQPHFLIVESPSSLQDKLLNCNTSFLWIMASNCNDVTAFKNKQCALVSGVSIDKTWKFSWAVSAVTDSHR